VDGLMEFNGPKIKNNDKRQARIIANEWGYDLSDEYTYPPLMIRLKIWWRSIFRMNPNKSF